MSDLWVNSDGDVAHPDSPRGGCGPGRSCGLGALGRDVYADSKLPPPNAPGARYLTQNDIEMMHAAKSALTGNKTEQLTVDELGTRVKTLAEQAVNTDAKGSCGDLVDRILQEAGAKSIGDYTPCYYDRHTHEWEYVNDYVWGKQVKLDEARPGDIFQYGKHSGNIHTETVTTRTDPQGNWKKNITTEDTPCGGTHHHTSIVTATYADHTFTVVEQGLQDRKTHEVSRVVTQRKEYVYSSHETKDVVTHFEDNVRVDVQVTVIITVHPAIKAYRPQPRTPDRNNPVCQPKIRAA